MAKIYTAQEMRDAADLREAWGDKDEVNNMLRQAAEFMEREERRELKYEYKVVYCGCDGRVYDSMSHAENILSARKTFGVYSCYKDAHIVRRPVGEWEVVKV